MNCRASRKISAMCAVIDNEIPILVSYTRESILHEINSTPLVKVMYFGRIKSESKVDAKHGITVNEGSLRLIKINGHGYNVMNMGDRNFISFDIDYGFENFVGTDLILEELSRLFNGPNEDSLVKRISRELGIQKSLNDEDEKPKLVSVA